MGFHKLGIIIASGKLYILSALIGIYLKSAIYSDKTVVLISKLG
jgi:hypothetical protein